MTSELVGPVVAGTPGPPRATVSLAHPLRQRALTLWPRLDRARLRHAGDNPGRIALLVARRSGLPFEAIVRMLAGSGSGDEPSAKS